jgi:hypothetical protein
MEERAIKALRGRLDALGYHDKVHISSMPLVARLVDELQARSSVNPGRSPSTADAANARRLQAALEAEKRARQEAEEKLTKVRCTELEGAYGAPMRAVGSMQCSMRPMQAIAENASIEREIASMRGSIKLVHGHSSTANALAAAEVHNALHSLHSLRKQLAESQRAEERMRSQLEAAKEDRSGARAQAASLHSEVEALRRVAADAQAQAEQSHRLVRRLPEILSLPFGGLRVLPVLQCTGLADDVPAPEP